MRQQVPDRPLQSLAGQKRQDVSFRWPARSLPSNTLRLNKHGRGLRHAEATVSLPPQIGGRATALRLGQPKDLLAVLSQRVTIDPNSVCIIIHEARKLPKRFGGRAPGWEVCLSLGAARDYPRSSSSRAPLLYLVFADVTAGDYGTCHRRRQAPTYFWFQAAAGNAGRHCIVFYVHLLLLCRVSLRS